MRVASHEIIKVHRSGSIGGDQVGADYGNGRAQKRKYVLRPVILMNPCCPSMTETLTQWFGGKGALRRWSRTVRFSWQLASLRCWRAADQRRLGKWRRRGKGRSAYWRRVGWSPRRNWRGARRRWRLLLGPGWQQNSNQYCRDDKKLPHRSLPTASDIRRVVNLSYHLHGDYGR